MASRSADCVFGVARLISSASTTLAKIGPGWNSKNVPAVRVLLHDVGADDVGRHEVGRELDAREREVQHVGQRVHQARLADSRDPFEQHMSAREEAGHREVHDLFVTDDAAADFARDADEAIAELIDGRSDGGCSHGLRMK